MGYGSLNIFFNESNYNWTNKIMIKTSLWKARANFFFGRFQFKFKNGTGNNSQNTEVEILNLIPPLSVYASILIYSTRLNTFGVEMCYTFNIQT